MALVGLNAVIAGGTITPVKINPALLTIPPGVVTVTVPDAPAPTYAVILDALFTTNDDAATPPNVTAVAFDKLEP